MGPDAGGNAVSGSEAVGPDAGGNAMSGSEAVGPDAGGNAVSGSEAVGPDAGGDAVSGSVAVGPDAVSGDAVSGGTHLSTCEAAWEAAYCLVPLRHLRGGLQAHVTE